MRARTHPTQELGYDDHTLDEEGYLADEDRGPEETIDLAKRARGWLRVTILAMLVCTHDERLYP